MSNCLYILFTYFFIYFNLSVDVVSVYLFYLFSFYILIYPSMMLRNLFILLFYLPDIISISIQLSIISLRMLLLYGHINIFILSVFSTSVYLMKFLNF